MRYNKWFVLFLVFALSLLLASCGREASDSTNETNTSPQAGEEEDPVVSVFTDYVENQIDLILRDFWPLNDQTHPYAVSDEIGKGYYDATLWDYSALYTTAMKYYKVTDREVNQAKWEKLISGLEWYLSTDRTDYLVYASQNGREKPAFYDDNVWVLMGFLEAYEITKDEKWLEQAKKLQDYIYTGWDTSDLNHEYAGGLLWREYPKDANGNYNFEGFETIDRNTCINGPAIITSVKLYLFTGDESYLDWAKRIYEWTTTHLRSNLGLYYDRVMLYPNGEVRIDETVYTYNIGTMISAGVLLYEATNDDRYLDDAKLTARNAEQFKSITYPDVKDARFYISDEPWFRVYLIQGYLDLARVDESSRGYIERVANALQYAWDHGRDERGYVLSAWGKNPNDSKMRELRHIAGNTECLALIAEYELYVKPSYKQ